MVANSGTSFGVKFEVGLRCNILELGSVHATNTGVGVRFNLAPWANQVPDGYSFAGYRHPMPTIRRQMATASSRACCSVLPSTPAAACSRWPLRNRPLRLPDVDQHVPGIGSSLRRIIGQLQPHQSLWVPADAPATVLARDDRISVTSSISACAAYFVRTCEIARPKYKRLVRPHPTVSTARHRGLILSKKVARTSR
jgi:hypothetical protein